MLNNILVKTNNNYEILWIRQAGKAWCKKDKFNINGNGVSNAYDPHTIRTILHVLDL